MSDHIVVHPGGAHLDEVIATGLICFSEGPLPVFRGIPTEEELEDPAVWVVDTGGRHEPHLRNFDHHQRTRDEVPECAMSLVAQHLLLHETLSEMPWYLAQVRIDVSGPQPLARELGLDRLPPELDSPFEIAICRLWAAGGKGPVAEDVVHMATAMAGALVEEARQLRADLDAARAVTEVIQVAGLDVFFHEGMVGSDVSGLMRDELARDGGVDIAVAISRDDRNPDGWSLHRFDDHPQVDFTRIEGDPRVTFAHKSGFKAKVQAGVARADLRELLQRALGEGGE
jgi:hypothetical protein